MRLLKTLFLILKTRNYHEKLHHLLEFPAKIRRIFFIILSLAIALIVVGVVFLLDSFGVLSVGFLSLIWPIILISLGILLFIKVHHFYGFFKKINKMAQKVEKEILHPFDD